MLVPSPRMAAIGRMKSPTLVFFKPPHFPKNNTALGSIAASKSYRCKDNKLVYIDWMSDGTARVKNTREEVGTPVTPGTNLKGDANAKTVSYNGQDCDS